MIDFAPFLDQLADTSLRDWRAPLAARVRAAVAPGRHGRLPAWRAVLDALPPVTARHVDLNRDRLLIGDADELDGAGRARLAELLRQLIPWRKGPFEVFGIHIDTEWRSDWKWRRLAGHIAPLAGRRVLDVGCGSGYHCWRAAGAGAELVVGVDPSLLYVIQFLTIHRLHPLQSIMVLPVTLEDLPQGGGAFDTVFSMGVVYHRRSPIDHLFRLRDCLRPGGQLVLETLVVDGPQGYALTPADRYAKMRNVWFIPSLPTLERWLARAGFAGVRCVDVARTTVAEQRSTEWMPGESLRDFLDPQDACRTVEGYPAPQRAIVLAERR